jgi:SAM-dependent methyltransferase
MVESNPYVLGGQITAEGERLLHQCRGLEREARWLLDRVGVQPGWRAVDVGCGPLGVLDLLAERVGPDGEVVGLERDARLVAMGETLLEQRDLRNPRFALGDAYDSGLSRGTFDLAHARLLLINLTDPGRALAEMVALVRPGGIIAVQDIDQVPWLCEPPHPAWDALVGAFLLVWRANGLDPLIGHRLPALLRAAGLAEVEVEVHGRADPPGAYHRKHLLGLIEAIRGEIVERRLFTEQELAALTGALERHLDDPRTLVTRPLLFQAWGRKPA